jgi:hypothetical protein
MSDEHEPTPEQAPEASEPHPMDLLIDRWWEDNFPSSAVARDTGAWNLAFAAKEKLKVLLRSKS